jgi:hypothetical protein
MTDFSKTERKLMNIFKRRTYWFMSYESEHKIGHKASQIEGGNPLDALAAMKRDIESKHNISIIVKQFHRL